MANSINVLDAAGSIVAVATNDAVIAKLPAALGQTTMSASTPVAIASDDSIQAKLGIVTETAPASDTASSGLNGRAQRIAQRLTSLIALLPTAIGPQAKAASLAVTIATDEPLIGILTETAPASDTASSGLNGRLQRIAQRLTSLIAQIPATLGVKASAASMAVVLASDDAQVGTKVTAITALATGGTGIIGWLSQIWNELQARLPATLGAKTGATSLSVVPSTDTGWAKRFFAAAVTTLTRPANVTAYSALDSVSNNATAGSVTALSASLSDLNDAPILITELLMHSTDTGVATHSFRAYLYNSDPTASTGVVGGDNAAFSNKKAGFLGTMIGTFRAFSDGSVAHMTSEDGGPGLVTTPTSGAKTIFVQLQTLDAFTPSANSTTFIGTLKGEQGRA